ncbi:MAG: hypothetical protein HKN56_11360, partial [Gammaproteobacteria bacterium]|nr:hypothetical protein [Gammaproteobacteria bacterium]
PWIWSNLYELRSFFMTASYPSTFVFGLSLISFWLTLSFMRGMTGFFSGLALLLLLSALGFVSHALTGVFLVGATCLLAVTEQDAPPSLRVMVIIAACSGPLLAALWPFFPVWDVILASSAEVDDRTWQVFSGFDAMLERARSGAWWHMFFDPAQFITSLGPALLGIPLALWLLLRWRELFIPLGLLMMTGPLILNVFFQVALAHRFLLYAVFFMHLAIVWGILELFDRWRIQRRENKRTPGVTITVGAVRVLVALAVIGHVALLIGDYNGKHLKYTLELIDKRHALPAGYDTPRLYTELTEELPQDAVVIGNSRLTWPLSTFRGKAVALPENHENSLLRDQFERVDAVNLWLAPATSAEDRARIAALYDATHALVNLQTTDVAVLQWLSDNAIPLTTVERYRMYRLN